MDYVVCFVLRAWRVPAHVLSQTFNAFCVFLIFPRSVCYGVFYVFWSTLAGVVFLFDFMRFYQFQRFWRVLICLCPLVYPARFSTLGAVWRNLQRGRGAKISGKQLSDLAVLFLRIAVSHLFTRFGRRRLSTRFAIPSAGPAFGRPRPFFQPGGGGGRHPK